MAVAEVLVVGAGIMGASVAFHLAERGVDTLVVDREGPAAGSTARSGAIVRCHYSTALESDLAWESLTDYFERWGERVGGGCGFTRTGFAFLSGSEDALALRKNVEMLQSRVRLDTELVAPEEIREVDPALDTAGVEAAAFEPRGGYADPTATTLSLLNAARGLGARFERRRIVSLLEDGGRVSGAKTEDGTIESGTVVLAAGGWSVPLARSVGVGLPIECARVQVALFDRPYELPTHLTALDAVHHSYFRPTAEGCTLAGSRTAKRQWLRDPDHCSPIPDRDFVGEASRRVGSRVPKLLNRPYVSGRAGVVDVTPDLRPILGPAGPEGLFLSAGWSGAGFNKSPAIGAELARWIVDGSPARSDVVGYGLQRFERGDLIYGEYEYSSSGPH